MRLRIRLLGLLLSGAACGSPGPPTAPLPPAPAAPVASPAVPQVSNLTWRNMTPTLAHEPPCCGDPYVVSCDVKDAEGDAVAVTIAMREFGGACLTPERCWTETRSYRPGEIGTGVRMEVHESTVIAAAGSVGGVAGTALTCQAIDSHGSTATVTSCIPLPFAGCP